MQDYCAAMVQSCIAVIFLWRLVMCMGSTKVVAPPPPPPVEDAPAVVDTTGAGSKEVSAVAKQAKKEEAVKAKQRTGRAATILTGSLGVQEEARTGKTVLGS